MNPETKKIKKPSRFKWPYSDKLLVLEFEKYIQHLEQEWDVLKERIDKLELLTDDDHTVEEWIKMWMDEADGMETLARKRGQERDGLKESLENCNEVGVEIEGILLDKAKELQDLKETYEKMSHLIHQCKCPKCGIDMFDKFNASLHDIDKCGEPRPAVKENYEGA